MTHRPTERVGGLWGGGLLWHLSSQAESTLGGEVQVASAVAWAQGLKASRFSHVAQLPAAPCLAWSTRLALKIRLAPSHMTPYFPSLL